MTDFLIQAPDMPSLMSYAASLGEPFFDGINQTIRVAGPLPGGGSYFVNFAQDQIPTGNMIEDQFGDKIPEMKSLDGIWVRVRLNGENLFALGMLPMPVAPLIVYPPTGTLGQSEGYVQPVYGSIA